MESVSRDNLTPGQKRIKCGDYIFFITETGDGKLNVDCEHRRTYQKYSSGEIKLQRLNPQTVQVALEKSHKTISSEVHVADAKLILSINVNHEFLPLITESIDMTLIYEAESNPSLQIFKNMTNEIEEIREEMRDLCLPCNESSKYGLSVGSVSSSSQVISTLALPVVGNYIVGVSYNSKSTSSEPVLNFTAKFVETGEQAYQTEVGSQFTYTGYTTFQNFSFIVNKKNSNQKTLEISVSANGSTSLTNVVLTLCSAR